MNIFNRFEAEFETITAQMRVDGELPSALDTGRVVFELPRDASHGDLACNAAMVLAKPAGMKPRDLATIFARHLQALTVLPISRLLAPALSISGSRRSCGRMN